MLSIQQINCLHHISLASWQDFLISRLLFFISFSVHFSDCLGLKLSQQNYFNYNIKYNLICSLVLNIFLKINFLSLNILQISNQIQNRDSCYKSPVCVTGTKFKQIPSKSSHDYCSNLFQLENQFSRLKATNCSHLSFTS